MGCVPRIGQWLATYGGPDDTTYARAVGELILVAAGRRVRQPGVKFDEMLVLESPQGTNKSTALKALAVRDDWFTDDLPLNAEAKRVIDALSGKWIVEAVELKGMRQGGANHLKGLLSRTHDNLAPKAEAKACRAGTKQAILVDLLFRSGGASMAELREALAPWKDITIKSGLGWDMNAIKGYGIRTTFENGYQRRLATDSAGMGTFRGDTHPDDNSETDQAALLVQNLADGYDPAEMFAVYHLVLPEGMTAPVPHTPRAGAALEAVAA